MKILFKLALAIAASVTVSASLLAQWPDFKTPGAPRLPNGQVDLNAPTPRAADGKPDLSGIWQNGRGGQGGGGGGAAANANAAGRGGGNAGAANAGGRGGANAAPAGAPNAAAPAAAGANPAGAGGQRGAGAAGGGGGRGAAAAAAPGGIPLANFGNIGGGFPDGLPMQQWAADLVKVRMANNSKDNPDAHCLPMGFMQFHTHPQPRKIIQTPGVIVMIYEANHGLRQIFTDGRALPPKDALPWWYGYSVGKWEGDTLVVETTGFLDTEPLWLDVRGSPLTEQGKVTEKFRRTNYGSLEIEITIDDPKAYTKPFTVRLQQRLLPDTELIEFICEERDATHYVGGAAK